MAGEPRGIAVENSAGGVAGRFSLDGLTALVSGAGKGIGEAAAVGLAEAGADVVVLSRTAADLERVASQVEERGRSSQTVVCDVTDAAAVARAVDGLERIDVLVNSAGTNLPEPFVEVSEAHFDALFELNVKGTFFTSQPVVRKMVEQGSGGAIINVSSQMGHVGAARRTVYCATKHAVEGLTKAMAVELAPEGIRVNTVAPTFVMTPMTRPFFEDEKFRADAIARIPLGRIGAVGDVVGAVVYLASPAAALVTGTSLIVDGGWVAQ